jgi:ribonuclease Z
MRVKFWGVRGSTPTPQPENLRYGGNTPCVEVRVNGSQYIFDCGTGLRQLGKQMLAEAQGKPITSNIFLTHFHWDHIQGLPFFWPLYENKAHRFTLHSSTRTPNFQIALERQMADPYFPVRMDQIKAQMAFFDIGEDRIAFDDCAITSISLNHPQGCLGFRIETEKRAVVYATDNEPGVAKFDRNVRKLAKNADVLIYDAQFLPEEYENGRRGWGHSTWVEAVSVANDAGVKELILFHHDPDHDDACVDAIVRQAQQNFPQTRAAAEGMEIEVK